MPRDAGAGRGSLLFRGPTEAVPEVQAPPATDWGAALFAGRAPEAAPAPEVAAEPSLPEAAPIFDPSEWFSNDAEVEPTYRDLAGFCEAALARSADDASAAPSPPRNAKPDRCNELPLEVPFRPDATFVAARAVRVERDGFAYTTLLVRTARGLAALPISWDVEDPDDPGCPSIVRPVALESVGVQHGLLVVVALGEISVEVPARDDSVEWRRRLLREVSIVKADDASLHVRTFGGWSGPPLGDKTQPDERGSLPWSAIAWDGRRAFEVSARGVLTVTDR